MLFRPLIKYLISSPYGDIPADKKKWHLPLEGDALKTPYKRYFCSIRDFIVRDELKPLLDAASKKLGQEIQRKEINEIIIRSEKHGSLYHPASVEVILKQDRVKFGLNVAVSDTGRQWLQEEFDVLQKLNTKFNLPYLPKVYFLNEMNSMQFLLEEWFEGYHEFHVSKDESGKQRLKLWNFSNPGSGNIYLSSEQSFEIYKQTSKILTFYYDMKDYSQILHWHHAAGDFVVKIDDKVVCPPRPNPPPSRGRECTESLPSKGRRYVGSLPLRRGEGKRSLFSRERESIRFADKDSLSAGGRGLGGGGIDVRLTTARRYEPFIDFTEKDTLNPVLALCYYLLDLTIRMRLDKLDGIEEVVWADDNCVEATITGFFEALKLKMDLKHHPGQAEDFAILLRSFTPEELKTIFDPLIDHYRGTGDFSVIISNLNKHIDKLYISLQNLPL
ncbi:MAG: hypothetical protein AB1390_10075 [Nitrospirota bacterium]